MECSYFQMEQNSLAIGRKTKPEGSEDWNLSIELITKEILRKIKFLKGN